MLMTPRESPVSAGLPSRRRNVAESTSHSQCTATLCYSRLPQQLPTDAQQHTRRRASQLEVSPSSDDYYAFATRQCRKKHCFSLSGCPSLRPFGRWFIHLPGQILLPWYLMNGLSNLDEIYLEYSVAHTDDQNRFWRSKIKGQGHSRPLRWRGHLRRRLGVHLLLYGSKPGFNRVLAVFTCSDITPPEVYRFGWNLENFETLSTLSTAMAVATAGEPGEIFVR